MADIDDQALEWAQSNSQDPRAQDIMAKSWAAKNPQDPRSSQIMAKFSQPESFMDRLSDSYNKFTGSHPGETAGEAAQRALRPINSPSDLSPSERMAFQSGQGDAAKAAGEPLAKLAGMLGGGITKGGDMLMQKAVGLSRYVPGVGETLADEGVLGTKGMMRGQIENALESKGQEMGSLARSVPEVDTQPVAEKLGEKASSYISPEGQVLPQQMPEFNKFSQAASDVSGEGPISGEEAAFRRMQYGKIAKNAGRYRENPAQGLKAQLAGQQQAGYSEALKQAAPGLSDIDNAYGNLSTADAAMSKPESLGSMNLVGKFVPTSLVESAAGRALIPTGRAVSSMQTPLQYTPATLAELLGKNNQ